MMDVTAIKKPNNQADNQDQIGSINDSDTEKPKLKPLKYQVHKVIPKKVAKSTLLIGHVGFLISAIYSPIILYKDIDNSLINILLS